MKTGLWLLFLGSFLLLALALRAKGRRRRESWKGSYSKAAALILAGTAVGALLVLGPWHLRMSASVNVSLYIPASLVFAALAVPDKRQIRSSLAIGAGCIALASFFYWQVPVKPQSSAFWGSAGAPGPYLAAATFLLVYAASRAIMKRYPRSNAEG